MSAEDVARAQEVDPPTLTGATLTDGFVNNYVSLGKLFELYGGDYAWDVKGTVAKESSSRIAVDLALRQLVDATKRRLWRDGV
jgi:hypothetical protein